MYKYLCVISDNAGKKDFYNTVEDVKNCYPDYRDVPAENPNRNCLQQVMSVAENNTKKTVCIRYDFSDRKVSVLSDIYIDKLFNGKKIENVGEYSDDISKAVSIILSIIFFVLNIAAALTAFEFELESLPNVIIFAVLTVIYIISAVIIENKREINEFKISFIQFGGYITVVIFLFAICFCLIAQGWTGVGVALCGMYFLKAVIPALILSLIIRLIIKAVKNNF